MIRLRLVIFCLEGFLLGMALMMRGMAGGIAFWLFSSILGFGIFGVFGHAFMLVSSDIYVRQTNLMKFCLKKGNVIEIISQI